MLILRNNLHIEINLLSKQLQNCTRCVYLYSASPEGHATQLTQVMKVLHTVQALRSTNNFSLSPNPFTHKVYWLIRIDRLCGLVVRVSGYRSRGPGLDSRLYLVFWEVGGLERGPLSLMMTTEELLEWKSSGSGLENRD
jgi:hypothetical protein